MAELLTPADLNNIRIMRGHKLDRLFGSTIVDDLLDIIDAQQDQIDDLAAELWEAEQHQDPYRLRA
jgi:hypothetical protein